MGRLRDQGNEVYEADNVVDRTSANGSTHFLAAAASDAVPSGDTDGFSLDGWNDLLVSLTVIGAVTDYQWILYFYDGRNWKVIEDSSGLAVSEFDPTADFNENYYTVDWKRGYFRMISCTAGTGIDIVLNRGI